MRHKILLILFLSILFQGMKAQTDFDASAYDILFLTKDITAEGDLEEQGLVNDLKSRGLNVDVTYNNPEGLGYETDVDFSYEVANEYDLIIIGRGVSSGDFQDIEGWASVSTPIIHFSSYIMRSSRLNLINSTSARRETADASTVPMDRVANIMIEDHPVFTGLDNDGDGQIGYHTWFHDYIVYGVDSFEMNHGATLLGTWATDSLSVGNVAVAMWDEGAETYTGSGTTLAGKRFYLQMGSDDNSSPKVKNFTAFTPESTLLLHNTIKMLLGATPDGALIPLAGQASLGKIAYITKDVDENGNYEEIEIIAELRKRGYEVDVTYNNEGSITIPADFEFSFEALNNYDVVMLGRGVSSGDFTDAAEWAAVETPIIVFSAYLMRNNRLNIMNTGSASRETGDGNEVSPDRVTNIVIEEHPAFTGIDDDDQIGYQTWFYDYIGYGADSFEINHNATLLGTLTDPDGPGDGAVYVALWDAGVETYPGSGTTVAGPRLYMQMGSDDSNSPKLRNFTPFTTEAYIALFNALAILNGEEPTGELPVAGPVAQWTFSEGEGTEVADIIGGSDGEIMAGNGITWESCGVGSAINFAGSTKDEAIIYVNDNPNINFGQDESFSISVLAKIDPLALTAEMNLILKGDNRSDGTHLENGNGHYYTIATKDNQLRFAIDDDVTKTQLGVDISADNFDVSQWNHIVAVRDATQDSLFLYLNGSKIGSILDETDGDISTTGLPVVIGNYHQFGRKVNGLIDEIAIYDFAFSESEVEELSSSLEIDNECEVLSTIEELSNDADLSSISVEPGTISPAFDPAITSYTATVPEGTSAVTISATTSSDAAVVSGTGEFSEIPGTTTLSVTAEDGTMKDYSVSVIVEGAGNSKTVVEPGFETLWAAINSAVSGDTLVLKNGETYTPIESYKINKKIVIIAEEIPELPGLENMPIIENLFAASPLFTLEFGADLHLIGIDVDGQGATNIFDTDPTVGASMAIYVNRCRLHNTVDDIFDDAADGGITETNISSAVFRNSFVYDSGSGHGLYFKNYYGEGKMVFENLTTWNLGEQFNWIRHFPAGITQAFVYDHITGYSLSTDLADDKEIMGNSDNPAAESILDISVSNNIFHTQLSANEGSLKFNNTSEAHNINILNNVLFNVQPIFDVGGTIGKENNLIDVDPMFLDPDNGDFTVMNAELYGAATDGEIIGATYWHPDFVDDFADLVSGIEEYDFSYVDMKFSPNPVVENVELEFTLEESNDVRLEAYNMNGQLVAVLMKERFSAGTHNRNFEIRDFDQGVYFLKLVSGKKFNTKRLIKVK